MGDGEPAGSFTTTTRLDRQPRRRGHLRGLLLDGAAQGPDAVRTIVGAIRTLYERQQFNFAGPYGDSGWLDDDTAQVRGEPIGCAVLVTINAAGRAQHSPRTTGHAVPCYSYPAGGREARRHPLCQVLPRARVLKRTTGSRLIPACPRVRDGPDLWSPFPRDLSCAEESRPRRRGPPFGPGPPVVLHSGQRVGSPSAGQTRIRARACWRNLGQE